MGPRPERSLQSQRDRPFDHLTHRDNAVAASEVVAVRVTSICPGESPRLNGEDKAHIMRLAETETPLPPILVDRRTMRVIDGMHRLMAASMRGQETINVVFFDGSEADVFLRAVQENVAHGLPLSQADQSPSSTSVVGTGVFRKVLLVGW